MDVFNIILQVLAPVNLLALVAATVVGIIIGAMPGLGPTFALALFLPITFTMETTTALIFLAALYSSTVYGGSISAILLNIPGHAGAICTAMDGFPMAKAGKAGEALGIATTASLVGGVIGFVALILLGPRLAIVALRFSPADYFWLVFSGMSLISFTSKDKFLKSLILSVFGMASSLIGYDMIRGLPRFTMGVLYLEDGFNFVALTVGMFALGQVFVMFSDPTPVTADAFAVSNTWQGFINTFKNWVSTLRSSILGTVVGIIPGIGMASASFFSYILEQRMSKTPDGFGKGDPKGIIASEAANNAAVGGALVPALSLGIPGGAGAAMYIVALTIHGISPGLGFFKLKFIPILLAGMIISQFAFFAAGMAGGKLFVRVTKVSSAYLIPITLVFAFTGALSIRSSMVDLIVALIFGLFGYVLAYNKWPAACFILGALLGPMLEQNFFRALRVSNGSIGIFFHSPISIGLIIVNSVILLYGIYSNRPPSKVSTKKG
jgi:putative tricarboxylic transport membrane protein